MRHSYVIVDDNPESILATRAQAVRFQNFTFLGVAHNYDDALDLILETQPDFVFLEIDPINKQSGLSLHLINELHRYITVLPKIIVTTQTNDFASSAIRHEVFDYCLKPLQAKDIRKSILRYERQLHTIEPLESNPVAIPVAPVMSEIAINSNESVHESISTVESQATTQEEALEDELKPAADDIPESDNGVEPVATTENKAEIAPKPAEKPLVICVKSYGDYRFIEAKDISHLQADNNSTDIHLSNGEMVTAFKTLKHFENVLQSPFVRIHNSYIVNIDYVSRIHTGNSVCYIKNSTIKLPFSKSYKDNVDSIIGSISNGNYLEI